MELVLTIDVSDDSAICAIGEIKKILPKRYSLEVCAIPRKEYKETCELMAVSQTANGKYLQGVEVLPYDYKPRPVASSTMVKLDEFVVY